MTWSTLKGVRLATRIEFTAALAAQHHFVQLPSGRWTRTLGPPGLLGTGYRQVGRNVWRQEAA